MARMARALHFAILAHAVQSARLIGAGEDRAEVNSSAAGVAPPDASSGMPSIFLEHKDVFGQISDASTWSATVPQGNSSTKKRRIILTSDLFSSGLTKPTMKRVLSAMIDHGQNLKALWIHDARSGWSSSQISQAFFMDTLPEAYEFRMCGIRKNAGLWINRWDRDGAPMTLAKNIRLTPGRTKYEETDVDAVKAIIDQADVLYVPGGNPYTLMKQLRSPSGSQVWAHALARIRSGDLLYMSRSAGTIVAGSIIDTSPDPHPADFNMVGLDLLPWKMAYRPHYNGFFQNKEEAHTTEWRHHHPSNEWAHDDFLKHVAEKYSGVRAMHIHDGDILALNKGILSLMHGQTKATKEVFDDITHMFFDEGTGKVEHEVALGDKTYSCCCKRNARRNSVECELTETVFGMNLGCGMWSYSWEILRKRPLFRRAKNVGRCMVPHSSIPSSWRAS